MFSPPAASRSMVVLSQRCPQVVESGGELVVVSMGVSLIAPTSCASCASETRRALESRAQSGNITAK